MKIKFSILFLLILVNFSYANDGKGLFNIHCASCHEIGAKKLAPPTFAVVNHLKHHYSDKKQFTKSIINWVSNPNQENSIMPGAIRKFNLMPRLNIKEQDLLKIAEYLYSNNFKKPNWYDKHFQKEHGTKP